jgi:CRISPR-associated protein Cas1
MAQLRGLEGDAARQYFSTFNDMIVQQKADFVFSGRSKRPPLDKVNALLSFGYSLLAHDVEAALLSVGLDPYVGFMHTDRPGRISLALDIMEELRAVMVDRFVITLINLKQIKAKDFIQKESEGILMSDEARKIFLTEWHKRKQEDILHDFLGEKIKTGLIPYAQALILSRYLRAELNDYVPYFKR